MDQVNDITQAISELPAGGMIPVGLALIAGLLLWAAGRRILRATFIATGFVLGCTVGWLVGELLGLGMQIVVPTLVGGVVFACVAGLASRLVVAVTLALTLGIAAPLATMSLAQLRGSDQDQAAEEQIADPEGVAEAPGDQLPDEVAEWLDSFDPDSVDTAPSGDPSVETPPLDSPKDSPTGFPPDFLPDLPFDLPLDSATESVEGAVEIPEQAQRYVDHIQQIAKQLKNAVKAKWDATPDSARPSVVASGLGGLLVGMLLGALARAFSAVVVTAFSGSLLWLTCAWTIASNLGAPEGPWMPGSSASWITWWLITSVIGLVVQWTLRRKGADKPAEQ